MVLPCPVCPVIVVVAVPGCLLMKFLFGINMSTFPSRFIYFFLRSFLCRWKTFIHMRKLLMLLNDVTDKCYGPQTDREREEVGWRGFATALSGADMSYT